MLSKQGINRYKNVLYKDLIQSVENNDYEYQKLDEYAVVRDIVVKELQALIPSYDCFTDFEEEREILDRVDREDEEYIMEQKQEKENPTESDFWEKSVTRHMTIISEYTIRWLNTSYTRDTGSESPALEEAHRRVIESLQQFIPDEKDLIFKVKNEEAYIIVHVKDDVFEYASRIFTTFEAVTANIPIQNISNETFFFFKHFRDYFEEVSI